MPRKPNAFISKTYNLLSQKDCGDIISWGASRDTLIIHDQDAFEKEILPKYFKHGNIVSFIRQLNCYGFKKVTTKDAGYLEFKHKLFMEGQDKLLHLITRQNGNKKPVKVEENSNHVASLQQSIDDFDVMRKLVKDNDIMAQAIVSIKRQQLRTEQELLLMRKELSYTHNLLRNLIAQRSNDNTNTPRPPYFGQHLPVQPLPPPNVQQFSYTGNHHNSPVPTPCEESDNLSSPIENELQEIQPLESLGDDFPAFMQYGMPPMSHAYQQ